MLHPASAFGATRSLACSSAMLPDTKKCHSAGSGPLGPLELSRSLTSHGLVLIGVGRSPHQLPPTNFFLGASQALRPPLFSSLRSQGQTSSACVCMFGGQYPREMVPVLNTGLAGALFWPHKKQRRRGAATKG